MHHSWSHLFYLPSSHIMHHPWFPLPDQVTYFLSLFQIIFPPTSLTKRSACFTLKNLLCGCCPVTRRQNRWLGLFQTASSCLVCVKAGAAFQRPERLRRARRRRDALSSRRLFVHTKPIQDQKNSITKNQQGSAEEVNACV